MASIVDDHGYNQGYRPGKALEIRTLRRAEAMIREMKLAEISSGSILELGCGTGKLSYLLSERTSAEILGLDVCRPFIEEAKSRYGKPGLSYRLGDVRDRSGEWWGDRRYDYIVGDGILHHLIKDLDRTLSLLRQHLSSGGRLIFWEPNLQNPYVFLIFKFGMLRKFAKLDPDEMAFSADFISKKLSGAGFQKVRVEYRDFLLPNAPEPLIRPMIEVGRILEGLPAIRRWSQSLFIVADVA